MIDPFVGKYYSPTYVKKHILRLDDEQIEEITTENTEYTQQQHAEELLKMKTQGDVQNDLAVDKVKQIGEIQNELAADAPQQKENT